MVSRGGELRFLHLRHSVFMPRRKLNAYILIKEPRKSADYILKVFDEVEGSIIHAARELRTSHTSLYRWMTFLSTVVEDFDARFAALKKRHAKAAIRRASLAGKAGGRPKGTTKEVLEERRRAVQ